MMTLLPLQQQHHPAHDPSVFPSVQDLQSRPFADFVHPFLGYSRADPLVLAEAEQVILRGRLAEERGRLILLEVVEAEAEEPRARIDLQVAEGEGGEAA